MKWNSAVICWALLEKILCMKMWIHVHTNLKQRSKVIHSAWHSMLLNFIVLDPNSIYMYQSSTVFEKKYLWIFFSMYMEEEANFFIERLGSHAEQRWMISCPQYLIPSVFVPGYWAREKNFKGFLTYGVWRPACSLD